MIVKIVILAFMFLELSNVAALYFASGTKMANGVGVFSAWEQSKRYPEIHAFVRYLVYWVAGVKLIFLLLLGVIIWYGDPTLQRISLLALGLGTLTFYWRLFPLIRKMDKDGQIVPRRYSLILGGMILGILVLFALGVFLS